MKKWKIIIVVDGITREIILQADSYADAYIKADVQFPGCTVKSITEVR